MLATVISGALQGVAAQAVQVEVHTGEPGEPGLLVLGLPDTAVKESGRRVLSALMNGGFPTPWSRTTINLAPGHLRKEGPLYDLPIALGLLAACGKLEPTVCQRYLIAGELGLSGETRPIKGALAMGILARNLGLEGIILPAESAEEAALVEGLQVFSVHSLAEAYGFLQGLAILQPVTSPLPRLRAAAELSTENDFSDVKGQHLLRRAVEVAVAGGHNLLMIGPPGSGKSMIAKRIPTIMPEPAVEEYLHILNIHSSAGKTITEGGLVFRRPFRSPHHTISDVGLLGGGTIPGPGEISLAHLGVLFLDELPEFKRSVLEVLRQPLEDGDVTISRSAGKVTLPCAFMLVAAMNPCPCGYLGDRRHSCLCSPHMVQRYRARISGPLLDRIDLHIEAPALTIEELRREQPGESSSAIRARVEASRAIQTKRYNGQPGACNARLNHAGLRLHCRLSPDLGMVLQTAMEKLNLSARAYDRVLRVARTIADLSAAADIQLEHLMEAIQYRSLDRKTNE